MREACVCRFFFVQRSFFMFHIAFYLINWFAVPFCSLGCIYSLVSLIEMESHEFFIVNATICIHGIARVEFKTQVSRDRDDVAWPLWPGPKPGRDGGGDLDFELISMKIAALKSRPLAGLSTENGCENSARLLEVIQVKWAWNEVEIFLKLVKFKGYLGNFKTT